MSTTEAFAANFKAARNKHSSNPEPEVSGRFAANFKAAQAKSAARKHSSPGALTAPGKDEQRLDLFITKFGVERGVQYFRDQLSFAEALEREIDSLAAA